MSTTTKSRSALTTFGLLTIGLGLSGGALLGCGDDTAVALDGGGSDGSMTLDATKDSAKDSASPPDTSTGSDTSTGPDTTVGPDGSPGVDASDGGAVADGGDGGAAPEGGDGGDAEAGPAANIVIADQYNNRVIEIDRAGHVVWQFGDGKAVPGPTSVIGPNDSERLPNGQTLIAGTGDPSPAHSLACIALDAGTAGCPDNRVILVDRDGGIVWQYDQLNVPVFAAMLPTGNVLIADQGNNRIVEVTSDGGIAWQYGAFDGGLNSPNSAQRLTSGNTVIADEGAGRVIEIAADGGIVWEYRATTADGGPVTGTAPAFASRLPNGNTLITDQGTNLVSEVTPAKTVAWSYDTTDPRVDSGVTPVPTRAVRLANGHTLISNQFYHQVIEIDNSTPPKIVFTYGQLGVPGSGAGQLFGPYDAKQIGDFTGLTLPQ
jgi:hypothetical protein